MRYIKGCLRFLIIYGLCGFFDLSSQAADSSLSAASRFDYAYKLLQAAQQARDAGNAEESAKLYEEAEKEYTQLQRAFPAWETAITRYRAEFCHSELAAIRTELTPPAVIETVVAPPAASNKDDVALTDVHRDARSRLRDGQNEQARALLIDALKIDPDDATTRLLIAVAQCQLTNYTDARYILDEILQENPTNVSALLTMGLACYGDGETDEARTHIERAIELAPNSAEAHFDLARLLVATEPPDTVAAQQHYRRAMALGAAPDAALDAIFDAIPATNAPPVE